MKARCVVVTTDGRRYLTRWFADGVDIAASQRAIRAANKLAERKSLAVKHINGMFRGPHNNAQSARQPSTIDR